MQLNDLLGTQCKGGEVERQQGVQWTSNGLWCCGSHVRLICFLFFFGQHLQCNKTDRQIYKRRRAIVSAETVCKVRVSNHRSVDWCHEFDYGSLSSRVTFPPPPNPNVMCVCFGCVNKEFNMDKLMYCMIFKYVLLPRTGGVVKWENNLQDLNAIGCQIIIASH